jgi:hypothetical protein
MKVILYSVVNMFKAYGFTKTGYPTSSVIVSQDLELPALQPNEILVKVPSSD